MSRTVLIWDKRRGIEGMPADEFDRKFPGARSHEIRRDIDPYQSIVTGEVIGGRRQHKEHLREHNLQEVGNEPIRDNRPPELSDPGPDVKAALEMVESGYKPPPSGTYDEKEFDDA